nr:serine-threonine protein kinase, plant-type, putative [Ipomoea batatas]
MVIFDISHNNFVGAIPEWIGNLSGLRILLLNGNQFEGKIPIVCALLRLSVLDLSHNLLSGIIPHCLDLSGMIPETFSKLENIESLDLSHNKLSAGKSQSHSSTSIG